MRVDNRTAKDKEFDRKQLVLLWLVYFCIMASCFFGWFLILSLVF